MLCLDCCYLTFNKREDSWQCNYNGSLLDSQDVFEEGAEDCDDFHESRDRCSGCGYYETYSEDGEEKFWCEAHDEELPEPDCKLPEFCFIKQAMDAKTDPPNSAVGLQILEIKEKMEAKYWLKRK